MFHISVRKIYIRMGIEMEGTARHSGKIFLKVLSDLLYLTLCLTWGVGSIGINLYKQLSVLYWSEVIKLFVFVII